MCTGEQTCNIEDRIMRGKWRVFTTAVLLAAALCGMAASVAEENDTALEQVLARVDSPEGGREYITGNFYVARGPMHRGFPIMVTQVAVVMIITSRWGGRPRHPGHPGR